MARENPDEVQALFQDLLIAVTSFFRDANEFGALRPHLKDIISNKRDEFIRVWIPGVATGEEAYSLAILFSEIGRHMDPPEHVKLQIFATDIDANAIEVARKGFYSETSLGEVSEDLIERYFDSAPKGYFAKKNIREKMVFSLHNIAQDPPFLNIDLISCRNLLIYFQVSLQADVFARFHYSLVPNGLLFLGKSEAVAASESLFRPTRNDKHIFKQQPSHERKLPKDMFHERPARFVRERKSNFAKAPLETIHEASRRFDSLVKSIGPNALLINNDLQVLKAYGDVSKYIGLEAGVVDTKATSLLKNPYRQDVRFAVPPVVRKSQKMEGVTRSVEGNAQLRERILFYPIESGVGDETLALVVFEEWIEEDRTIEITDETSSEAKGQIEELSNELAIVKTNLQQTVEELETSNEELQSTNEELSTVNGELHVNSHQLNVVNQSLNSVLETISVPLIVVDRSFNITHISHVTENFFGI